MQTYANTGAVPLSLAVFLSTDSYDHSTDPHTISATTLMKPLRQIVLGARVKQEESAVDLISMVQSRMGSAIHDAIERSWTEHHATALKALGYPAKVIASVLVNPKPEELYEGCIPVYLEQRAYKQVGKHRVSGKFDIVLDGRVEDFKSTGAWKGLSSASEIVRCNQIMEMSEAACRIYYENKYGRVINNAGGL